MSRTITNIWAIYECENEGVIVRPHFLWGGQSTYPLFHSPFDAHDFIDKHGLAGVEYVVGPVVPQ